MRHAPGGPFIVRIHSAEAHRPPAADALLQLGEPTKRGSFAAFSQRQIRFFLGIYSDLSLLETFVARMLLHFRKAPI